jgi:hypothetical protein
MAKCCQCRFRCRKSSTDNQSLWTLEIISGVHIYDEEKQIWTHRKCIESRRLPTSHVWCNTCLWRLQSSTECTNSYTGSRASRYWKLVNAIDPGWVATDMGGGHGGRTVEEGAHGIV